MAVSVICANSQNIRFSICHISFSHVVRALKFCMWFYFVKRYMSCKFHLIRLILKNRVGTPNYSVRMNSKCMLAFTEVMTHDRMRQSYAQSHSVLQWWLIAHTISTETGTNVEKIITTNLNLSTLLDFISFKNGPED